LKSNAADGRDSELRSCPQWSFGGVAIGRCQFELWLPGLHVEQGSMSLSSLEQSCLTGHARGDALEGVGPGNHNETAWVEFGLRLLLESAEIVRDLRLLPVADAVNFKANGSPWTQQERQIEALVTERLAQFCPEAAFVGEESGGTLPVRGPALAIDPVDGTWSLVNHSETCTTTFAFYNDGEAFLGMVANPVTGELAYACRETGARFIQLPLFGAGEGARNLPFDRARPDSLLVNLQPQRNAGSAADGLFAAWRDKKISMLKMIGGSPSWSLFEAAKGSFVYVNLWTEHPADPFDLAAGVLLVRFAGGEVTDLAGTPIDPATHSGPFVAGIDARSRERVADLTGRCLGG
jgi:myo-inositol-1(or 4)-monophosphatase